MNKWDYMLRNNVGSEHTKLGRRAGEVVQWVKVATAKPDDLNLTPRTHMAEEN